MEKPSDFLVICITPEYPVAGEAERITRILRDGDADRVHIRHPHLDEDSTRALLREIPNDLYPRLTLHDHPSLVVELGVGGFQFNGRNRVFEDSFDSSALLSCSCHGIDEIMFRSSCTPLSYVTLSPIFDSISKPGYSSAFTPEYLQSELKKVSVPVIALGGVTPSRFPFLKDCGFSGAAMLGHFWK